MKQIATLLACSLPLTGIAADMRFTGEATPLDSDNVIYEERHVVEGECTGGHFRPTAHKVAYVHGNGETFAEKTMIYDKSPLRPSVDFQQPDFSEIMDIRNRNDSELDIKWQTPEGNTETSTVAITEKLVVDAGFDNLVRRYWSEVTSGETVAFDFLAPTRGKAYGFILEPTNDDRINAAHTVRIEPSGAILSFLVDPILLGYNENGALTDYLGLTNIRKDKDTNYIAHIRYTVETTPDCELTR